MQTKRIRISTVDEEGHIHYVRAPVDDCTSRLSDGNVMYLMSEQQILDLYEALGSVVSKIRPIRPMRRANSA